MKWFDVFWIFHTPLAVWLWCHDASYLAKKLLFGLLELLVRDGPLLVELAEVGQHPQGRIDRRGIPGNPDVRC